MKNLFETPLAAGRRLYEQNLYGCSDVMIITSTVIPNESHVADLAPATSTSSGTTVKFATQLIPVKNPLTTHLSAVMSAEAHRAKVEALAKEERLNHPLKISDLS